MLVPPGIPADLHISEHADTRKQQPGRPAGTVRSHRFPPKSQNASRYVYRVYYNNLVILCRAEGVTPSPYGKICVGETDPPPAPHPLSPLPCTLSLARALFVLPLRPSSP